ncbi:MAG: hypothetical protein VYA60_04725 [Pseudomonadota bacterium]|nr:hypothetical protein [Pseudomonadota bacterium]
MSKPIYPFQPFIEVSISDDYSNFYDRIFIPEDSLESLESDIVTAEFFYENIHKLMVKLGYPISKETLLANYSYLSVIQKSGATTIITKAEDIGSVTIQHTLVGMENAYRPIHINKEREDAESDVEPEDICVSAHITEMERLNNNRQSQKFLSSKIAIMVYSSEDGPLDDVKQEWLHYHMNNYMNRGYKIYVEILSDMGRDLMQYILNCNYSNCVVVLNGSPEKPNPIFHYQPIEACTPNKNGDTDAKYVMEQFATHVLDPFNDRVKQINALTEIVAA